MGAIGLGGRCLGQQVLQNFLAEPEVQMVAVCDVQSQRREAGQAVVNDTLRQPGLRRLPRSARAVGPRGYRRRADRHRRSLARAGLGAGGEGRQGRLLREAHVVDDRRGPGGGRHDADLRQGLPGRYAAAERAEVPSTRPKSPAAGSSAGCGPSTATRPASFPTSGRSRPGRPSPSRPARSSTGTCGWDRWHGGPTMPSTSPAWAVGATSPISAAEGSPIGERTRPTCRSTPTTRSCPRRSITEQLSGNEVAAEYPNGVRLVFHAGIPAGACLMIRFEGTEGWISVDDNLGFEADPPSLLGPYRPRERSTYDKAANHIQDFLRCIRTRSQPVCNAEVAHRATTACHAANLCVCLGRPLEMGPGQRRVRRRRRGKPNAQPRPARTVAVLNPQVA